MRVYKRVAANSTNDLKRQIKRWEQEGWRSGPIRTVIDALYPHQCHLHKDFNSNNEN